jgi:hypothetical protein
MGYTTNFSGEFKIDKPLKPEHTQYLRAFGETRRMERLTQEDMDAGRLEKIKRNAYRAGAGDGWSPCNSMPDPARVATGLPIGPSGAYFVGGAGFGGQSKDDSIINYNEPPEGQPGLWCQWVPNEEGTAIEWDGGEKFYNYVEWLQYLIHHFLAKWGYVLNGEVEWVGEDRSDTGKIVVENNEVTTKRGRVVYDDDDEDDGG